jgi:hypothetical protein
MYSCCCKKGRGALSSVTHTQMRAEKGFKPICCGIAAKHLSVFYECALGPSHLLMGNLIWAHKNREIFIDGITGE